MFSLNRLVHRGHRPTGRRQFGKAVHKYRPRLEGLENRRLLSTITDLGTLPNGAYSYAYGLNNWGQVVGISDSVSSGGYHFPHAFLWDGPHGMQDLGTLNGVGGSYAYGINDRDQVVGFSDSNSQGYMHAFLWDRRHGMQDLGTLHGGATSEATGINDRGQAVGASGDAFLWDRRHGLQDLGSLGGMGGSSAAGINEQGQVVGWSVVDGHGDYDAFRWDAQAGIQDLGTFPGANGTNAEGINDAGQVVGGSYVQLPYYKAPYHGFLWDAQNGMQDLGTLPGANTSEARGINDAAEVVGTSGMHAFLYCDGTMFDLNDFLPPNSGWTLTDATAINDAEQIVGYGTHNGGYSRAFLLTLDGGDQPGVVASASATGLGLIQIAGTLREAPDTSLASVSGVVAAIGQTGAPRPGPGLITELTPTASAPLSQGPAPSFVIAPGGSSAHVRDAAFQVWGDPLRDTLPISLP
jgi:probable HAF family extracellular repeat protein